MRVTESRLLELSTAAVGEARDRLAKAGQVMQSGVRVALPSDDVAAWATAARLAARQTLSAARGTAIGRARDNLADVDTALGTIGDALARLKETTIQAATGTLVAGDRAGLVAVVTGLRATALAAANARGADGEYLLAGSKGDAAPFAADGSYAGDAVERNVESAEGALSPAALSGDRLQALFPVFDKVSAALAANDVAGLQAALGDIGSAVETVSGARTAVGERLGELDAADEARQSFEVTLADAHARAVEADPIAAASELARASTALDAAKASAQEIIAAITRR
jgi:flagellar hook-associated protein 3 FlgL